jgi:hypothetical protein
MTVDQIQNFHATSILLRLSRSIALHQRW